MVYIPRPIPTRQIGEIPVSNFKYVTDVNSKKGLMSSRIDITLKRDTPLPIDVVDKIASAVDFILDGKTLILSGKEITVHGDISCQMDSIGSRATCNMSNSSILEKENESLGNQVRTLNTRNQNLLKETKELEEQRDMLQGIIDALDKVFQSVHVNSTRSVARRAAARKMRGF